MCRQNHCGIITDYGLYIWLIKWYLTSSVERIRSVIKILFNRILLLIFWYRSCASIYVMWWLTVGLYPCFYIYFNLQWSCMLFGLLLYTLLYCAWLGLLILIIYNPDSQNDAHHWIPCFHYFGGWLAFTGLSLVVIFFCKMLHVCTGK